MGDDTSGRQRKPMRYARACPKCGTGIVVTLEKDVPSIDVQNITCGCGTRHQRINLARIGASATEGE